MYMFRQPGQDAGRQTYRRIDEGAVIGLILYQRELVL